MADDPTPREADAEQRQCFHSIDAQLPLIVLAGRLKRHNGVTVDRSIFNGVESLLLATYRGQQFGLHDDWGDSWSIDCDASCPQDIRSEFARICERYAHRWRWLQSGFSRWHLWSALLLLATFSGLTCWIVSRGLDDAGDHPGVVIATTLSTFTGPMTGAISRGFQGCCLAFSLKLLPVCLLGLGIGVATQVVVKPGAWWRGCIRVALWIAGLLVWFGGGIVSFGHALS